MNCLSTHGSFIVGEVAFSSVTCNLNNSVALGQQIAFKKGEYLSTAITGMDYNSLMNYTPFVNSYFIMPYHTKVIASEMHALWPPILSRWYCCLSCSKCKLPYISIMKTSSHEFWLSRASEEIARLGTQNLKNEEFLPLWLLQSSVWT